MITIFFPAGSFGSTLEYLIRNYSTEFENIDAEICNTGSMHSFEKEFHPCWLSDFSLLKPEEHKIITPVWPGNDQLSPPEYVKKVSDLLPPASKVIFVCLKSQKQYELNELFCFHKVKDYFSTTIINFKQWNSSYESFNDMATWEIRENLSLIYLENNRFFRVKEEKFPLWFVTNPEEILYNLPELLPKILKYLELTPNNLDSFSDYYTNWFNAQQYILDEYNLITKILYSFQNNEYMKWDKLSIIGEAIVQSNLYKMGYNLKCFNLNIFPTDINDLKKISVVIKD